jgi:hypothetical protein
MATQTRLRCSKVEVIATKIYGRHHELIDRNEISISQMARVQIDEFTFVLGY